jgi:hypothetical protein
LDNGQDLPGCLFVFLLLCNVQAVVQVFPPIILSVLSEVFSLANTGLEMEEDLLDGEREGVRDVTASGRLFQVAPFPDSASMELEQGLVDVGSPNPEGCLWREWDVTRLDLTAFFLHIAHVLY